jgi:SH3-like domain-containing protein
MMFRLFVVLAALGFATSGVAADYRSVDVAAAILYDAPSQKAKKLYLVKAQTPLEVVVRLEGWFKVRDAEGTLAWIEAAQLAERRTLIVTAATADLRQAERVDAQLLGQLDKWVLLDYLGPATPGWAKVRHRDGVTGFVRSTQVWGL